MGDEKIKKRRVMGEKKGVGGSYCNFSDLDVKYQGRMLMDEFLRNLGSVSWWLGVVVVGIIINVISHFIPPVLGKLSTRYSDFMMKTSEKNRSEILNIVAHPELIQDYYSEAVLSFLGAGFSYTWVLPLLILTQNRYGIDPFKLPLDMPPETYYVYASMFVFMVFGFALAIIGIRKMSFSRVARALLIEMQNKSEVGEEDAE
jgi:hypothetical protein